MKDILQSIDRFIDHRMYHYALLINGKWGCGKTYFVQEILIPHLKKKTSSSGKKNDINYLSLYGVCSTEEISQMLCVHALKDKIGKTGKLIDTKGGQIATVLLSAATRFGFDKVGVKTKDLKRLIDIFPNYDNNIIIFDDLERCNCDISEVLGYINNFVEHSDASVILVANEDEIGNWQLDRNPEMQMLVALDKRIDVDVDPTKDEYIRNVTSRQSTKTKNSRESYTLDQLEQKRSVIFHSNDAYKRIKEKVIGQTINYEPDLKNVFTEIIYKNTNGNLHDALVSMVDEFVNVAEKEEHANLRTFQFFLEKVSIIFESIQDDDFSFLYHTILLYCYRSSVRYMKGMEMPKWDDDEYGEQQFDGMLFYATTIMGFKFIDELIAKNSFNDANVKSVLFKFKRLAEKKGQFKNDPYQLINNWYLASDEEVESWLTEIAKNIRSGKYSTALYSKMLSRIAELTSYNIMTDSCENIFSAMKEYINQADPMDLEELEPEHFFNDGEPVRIYKRMQIELEELMKTKKKLSEKQIFEAAIRKDEWGTALLNLASNDGNVRGHSFIYWLEPEDIAEKISESTNAELQQFRFAMQCYYDSSRIYYEAKPDDVEHLKEIQRLVDEADKDCIGQIHRQYYVWISNDIERYLESIPATKDTIV